jgi:hypothetical protein
VDLLHFTCTTCYIASHGLGGKRKELSKWECGAWDSGSASYQLMFIDATYSVGILSNPLIAVPTLSDQLRHLTLDGVNCCGELSPLVLPSSSSLDSPPSSYSPCPPL